MANPKGNPNITEYGHETRFGQPGRGCSAADDARKSNAVQKATKEVMELIAGKLPPEEAADVFIEKLMNGDLSAWRLWLEYTAEKPKETVGIESDNIEIHFNAV